MTNPIEEYSKHEKRVEDFIYRVVNLLNTADIEIDGFESTISHDGNDIRWTTKGDCLHVSWRYRDQWDDMMDTDSLLIIPASLYGASDEAIIQYYEEQEVKEQQEAEISIIAGYLQGASDLYGYEDVLDVNAMIEEAKDKAPFQMRDVVAKYYMKAKEEGKL